MMVCQNCWKSSNDLQWYALDKKSELAPRWFVMCCPNCRGGKVFTWGYTAIDLPKHRTMAIEYIDQSREGE